MNKVIGSYLILIGTTIGAGMLALPLVSSASGFLWASALLIAVWVLMTLTGLLVLEVNLALGNSGRSFSSMAEQTIGKIGKTTTWITCLLLLYALTAAYISGAASLLSALMNSYHIRIPHFLNAVFFTLLLGGTVFWSTQATDYLNRGLISIKGMLLLASFVLLAPNTSSKLLCIKGPMQAGHLNKMLPIFLCAFGYHIIIPSLRIYVGDKPRTLRLIVIIGTTTSLIVYLLWLVTTLGVVPLAGEQSFATITESNGSVGALISTITTLTQNKWLPTAINGFSNIAMATSFLGVTLGLFDFLADGFKRPNTRYGRAQTALLTFTPPLMFVFYYPQGFILALQYAAIFVAVLVVILPALMAYKLRSNRASTGYRVAGGNTLLIAIIIIGLIAIGIQLI